MQNFNEKTAVANENLVKNLAGNFSGMADDKLYELCQAYGERARLWREKFAGLLPEVFKRRLFERKGFSSIFEFAAKLAGMSEEQVRIVLHLEKKFEDKPVLKYMLENGEVSVHKLARLISVATHENQEFWATQVKLLPQKALETLVRDEKRAASALPENSSVEKSVRAHGLSDKSASSQALNLSAKVQEKLLELEQKGIDINSLLLEFLEKRDLEIAQKKEKLSVEAKPTNSHYIYAEVRAVVKEENGTKCSIKTCQEPAVAIHHSQRYALSKIHDPQYLAPLCKEHHQIAHSIDLKYHEARAHAGIQTESRTLSSF